MAVEDEFPWHAHIIPRNVMTSKKFNLHGFLSTLIDIEWQLNVSRTLHWTFKCPNANYTTEFTNKMFAKKVLQELIISVETKEKCSLSRMDDDLQSSIDLRDMLEIVYWLEPPPLCYAESTTTTTTSSSSCFMHPVITVQEDVICVDAIHLDRIAHTPDYFRFFTFGRKNLNFDNLTLTAYLPSVTQDKDVYDRMHLLRFANINEYIIKCMEHVGNNNKHKFQWEMDAFELLCNQHKNFRKSLLLTHNARLINKSGEWLEALQITRKKLKDPHCFQGSMIR